MKKAAFTLSILFFLAVGAHAQYNSGVLARNFDMLSKDTSKVKVQLYIPNAFTPNGDGLNDYFKVYGITNERIIDFRIFNRWGTILYRSNDNNAAWDGKYRSKLQPSNSYGYIIEVAFPEGRIETYKGIITLLN